MSTATVELSELFANAISVRTVRILCSDGQARSLERASHSVKDWAKLVKKHGQSLAIQMAAAEQDGEDSISMPSTVLPDGVQPVRAAVVAEQSGAIFKVPDMMLRVRESIAGRQLTPIECCNDWVAIVRADVPHEGRIQLPKEMTSDIEEGYIVGVGPACSLNESQLNVSFGDKVVFQNKTILYTKEDLPGYNGILVLFMLGRNLICKVPQN